MQELSGIATRISLLGAISLRMTEVKPVHNCAREVVGWARDLEVGVPFPGRDAFVTVHGPTRESLMLPHEIAAEREQAERCAHADAAELQREFPQHRVTVEDGLPTVRLAD